MDMGEERLRVLVISHTYIVRANQRKWEELANLYEIDLTVIVPAVWPDSYFPSRAEANSSSPFRLLTYPTWGEGVERKYVFRSLTLSLPASRPHIVHVEQGINTLAYFQTLVYKRLWVPEAKAVFFTWMNLPYRNSLPFKLIQRYNLRHSDHAIAGNAHAKTLLRQQGFRGPIAILPQIGVDPEVFKRQDAWFTVERLGLQPNQFVIGFVGRFVYEKGLLTLVEAAARLEGDWALLLVGRGELRERLLALTGELGVRERIYFVDSVPHFEVIPYLNCIDVLVLPSLMIPTWKEQFGHVLIEAMSCEVPVIGSDSGEIPNVISDAGLIFPEGDVNALHRQLMLLMDSPTLHADLAARGRQRVLDKYTHRRIAEATYQIWQEMLSS